MRKFCLLTVFALALAQPAGAEEQLVDGIAAQVGADIVLVSEVTRMVAPMEAQMRAAGAKDSDIAVVQADVLERLIERRLVEQVVRRMELEATDAEVDQAVAAIASENGLSVDQLRQSLTGHDLSWESYREKIRGEIQRTKILNGMVRSKVKVEEQQVRDLYSERYSGQRKGGSEMHLRHLVVVAGDEVGRTQEEACGTVQGALVRIRAGQPFTDLAREISDSNPQAGGDVGWVHEEDIAPWMADAVRGLEAGQVSEVIEMPFGCNLFEVVERRGFEPVSFEDAEQALWAEVYDQQLEIEYGKWIDELRGHTYIERKGIFAEAARLRVEAPEDPTAGSSLQPLPPIE